VGKMNKKILLCVLFVFTLLIFSGCQNDVDLQGLDFDLINGGKEYGVKACNTDLTSVIIPKEHKNKPVTFILTEAFKDNKEIKQIIIPESVVNIENRAFSGCKGLTNITLPESLVNIGDGVFHGCNNLINITIPINVTSIGSNTFENCSSLDSINIPSGIKTINSNTFNNCRGLKSVTFEKDSQLASIKKNAFFYCRNLDNIIIPKGVISIGEINTSRDSSSIIEIIKIGFL